MIEKKRKLIFFWAYLEWGGAQIYFMSIIKHAMHEWEVIVALPRLSSPEIVRFFDQIGVRCEFLDFHLDLDPAPTVIRKIQRQWRRIRCEILSLDWLRRYNLEDCILHIETSPWQSWVFLFLLSMKRANIFVTLHNAPFTGARWRRLIWKARMQFLSRLKRFHIFTSNHDTKNKIRPLVGQAFWDDIAVTYTCVSPSQISDVLSKTKNISSIRRQHGFEQSEFIVLCVGQFIDRKGRWVFLDAAKTLQIDNPDITFVWMAPMRPSKADLGLVARYALADNFKLVISANIGSTREEILEYFRIADIFILPSFIEGLPIALLEAMALGLPCISTSVFAIPEAINDGETGMLIEAGNPNALVREILKLKADPSLRNRIAQNGQNYVFKHFDEKVAAQTAIAKYKECFGD